MVIIYLQWIESFNLKICLVKLSVFFNFFNLKKDLNKNLKFKYNFNSGLKTLNTFFFIEIKTF